MSASPVPERTVAAVADRSGVRGSPQTPTPRNALRRALSFLPYSGIVPPPATFRPPGVSAFVIARNEETWVEASLRSIVDHVEEVVAADHGSDDRTREVIESVAQDYPGKIRLLPLTGEEPFPEALNKMIRECRHRWILRFSADFVARTSGPNSIDALVRAVRGLDRLRYFCIRLSGISLQGDLEHQFPSRRDPPEQIVFTYSPWLRYEVRGRWESLHVPAFYEKVSFPDAYYFHMGTLKPAVRVVQKLYWHEWFDARNKGSTVALRDFAAANALRDWGGSTFAEAARNYVLLEFQGCVPYSRELCGDYPDILLPALRDPPFRLVYRDGKLVDRIEKGRYRPEAWPGA